MKPLIKAAIVYRADLPAAEHLEKHLSEHLFAEPLSLEASSTGFVPLEATQEMVSAFEGGLAFCLRHDAKILPAAAVKAEAEKMAKSLEEAQGFKPGRKQMKELKEEALVTLLPRALVRTSYVTAFYLVDQKLLVVPTTSTATADMVTGMLIKAVGSVEFSTIHVSNVKHGLTTRLRFWLDADGCLDDDDKRGFASLQPSGDVKLVSAPGGSKEVLSLSFLSLETGKAGLLAALDKGFGVDSISFSYPDYDASFVLTSAFRLRSIRHEAAPDPAERNTDEAWRHQAAIESLYVREIVDDLVDLLSYVPPEDEAAGEREDDALA